MYNNGAVPRMSNINEMKQIYQALYQQNSSFRESLLVSPHYSKYQRQISPSNAQLKQQLKQMLNDNQSGNENSFLDYIIKPFESQQLKTRHKNWKKNNQNQNRMKTQSDCQDRNHFNQSGNGYQKDEINSFRYVNQLKAAIKQKDQRIQLLQKNLAQYTSNKKNLPTQYTLMNSPLPNSSELKNSLKSSAKNKTQLISSLNSKSTTKLQKKNQQVLASERQQISLKQKIYYLQSQLQNYKKQIKFLTHNNQQLYQQVCKINQHCQKLKKALNTTILFSRELEDKVKYLSSINVQLEESNNTLLIQKQEMMQNYEEQLQLFRKMRRVWQEQKYAKKERLESQNSRVLEKSKEKEKYRRQKDINKQNQKDYRQKDSQRSKEKYPPKYKRSESIKQKSRLQ